MKRIFLLLLFVVAQFSVSYAQQLNGTWHGRLSVGGQQLGLVFHFNEDGSGRCMGKMDIPQQGAFGVPVDVLSVTSDSLSLRISAIGVLYSGKLEKEVVKGVFKQNGMSFPLDLMPGGLDNPNRPQEPKAPFDYRTEEITFENRMANATFSGTLTYPTGYTSGKCVPVVIMVTGSGAQNRDEELFGHKPFAVIADYLAKQGVASLRYDDRGTGKSTGKRTEATSEDYADDVRAGLRWLRGSGKFSKVGILGHSEGGLIAFMLGTEKAADFIVSMAGPGIKGDTLLAEQQNAVLRLYGQPADRTVKSVREEIASQPRNAWLEFFLNYDPSSVIQNIEIPVMAINGSNDVQVIASSNLSAIRRLLANGSEKNLIKEYPGLNHLFQHCQPASALDYYRIEETCSSAVLQDIADWIKGL